MNLISRTYSLKRLDWPTRHEFSLGKDFSAFAANPGHLKIENALVSSGLLIIKLLPLRSSFFREDQRYGIIVLLLIAPVYEKYLFVSFLYKTFQILPKRGKETRI